MEDYVIQHLRELYGLNPNTPHRAFQFPRLPPGLSNTIFKVHENPIQAKFAKDAESLSKKLQGFQHMYHRHVSGLLTMGSNVIPPGHPLYSKQNSVESLKTENDKLLKENLELKKKIDKQNKSS